MCTPASVISCRVELNAEVSPRLHTNCNAQKRQIGGRQIEFYTSFSFGGVDSRRVGQKRGQIGWFIVHRTRSFRQLCSLAMEYESGNRWRSQYVDDYTRYWRVCGVTNKHSVIFRPVAVLFVNNVTSISYYWNTRLESSYGISPGI